MRKSPTCTGLLSLLVFSGGGCEPQASGEKPHTSKDNSTISKPVALDNYGSGITTYKSEDNSTISKPLASEPQAPKERPYTSQFKYSTQIDPKDFGMEHKDPNSRRVGEFNLFSEGFVRKPHALLVARVSPLGSDLETAFYGAVTLQTKIHELDLGTGQGFRIVGEGKPVSINIDGMNGLKGGAQLWRYDTREDLFNQNYIDKRSVKLIIASDGTYHYTFTFMSWDINDSQYDSVVRVYEKFATSFKRPK